MVKRVEEAKHGGAPVIPALWRKKDYESSRSKVLSNKRERPHTHKNQCGTAMQWHATQQCKGGAYSTIHVTRRVKQLTHCLALYK